VGHGEDDGQMPVLLERLAIIAVRQLVLWWNERGHIRTALQRLCVGEMKVGTILVTDCTAG